MQLSFFIITVIISVTANIDLMESDEENTVMEISMEDSIHKMDQDESKNQRAHAEEFSPRIMENAPISQERLNPSQRRSGRMTYVKAILPNPKTSPIRHLAEKLAQAELKSPKMQETFKKLTAIHSPRGNSQKRTARSKISSSTFVTPDREKIRENYESSRHKRRRKRRRKRHKGDRTKDKRHSYKRRKWYNPRVRFVREIENSTRKNGERDSKDGLEKSISYRSVERRENLNDDHFQEEPYGSLNTGINYPGVEDFDNNYQNSMQNHDDPLNYGSNYSPIRNRAYNANLRNSMVDNGEDFSPSNDRMPINAFNLPETNLYSKIPYENVNDLDFPDNAENLMDSKQYEFPGPRPYVPHKNFRNHPNEPRVPSSSNFHIRNKFYSKMKNLRGNHGVKKSKNMRNQIAPTSNYRAESVNSTAGHEKSDESKSHVNFDTSAKPDNTTEAGSLVNVPSNNSTKSFSKDDVKTTTRNPSTKKNGKTLRTRKNSRVDKSEGPVGTSTSVSGTNSTTEKSLQLKGLDALSSVSPDVKASTGSANLKGNTEYRSNNTAIIKETRDVAGQILNSIIEELEDLKLNRNQNEHKEGSRCCCVVIAMWKSLRQSQARVNRKRSSILNYLRETLSLECHISGLPCRLSGSWITTQAGVRIDMLVTNHSVNVSLAKLNLPVGIRRRSLLNYTWNTTGYAPFRRGGPFSLVAVDDRTKSLAVFVGACRVCQGVDTIEGVWSIAREPRDCRDFQMATSIYNDIFRRTQLYSAIKDKRLAMLNDAKYATSSASSSIKEESFASDSEDKEFP